MTKKIAFVFPGQGSQTVGMLADFAKQYPIVQSTFQQASEVLGYDIWQLAQQGPIEKLNLTQYAQPALLTAGVAVWRALQQEKIPTPVILAGHSLGEYTALVCASALEFHDALKLVDARGRFMQEAVPEGQGAMAAIIGLDALKLQEVCEQARKQEVLSPANFNAIGQIVVAGHSGAVLRAIELAKQAGAKIAKKLPVSVPSHCSLMKPAAEKLQLELETIEFNTPEIPIINNVDVRLVTAPDDIKAALVKQLYSPVRWVETIQTMTADRVDTMLECGPGSILTGLIKRIDRDIKLVSIDDADILKTARQI